MTGTGSGDEPFRHRVQQFLDDRLPPGWAGIGALPPDERPGWRDAWRSTLFEHGYLGLSWPQKYGGTGLGLIEQCIAQEEFALRGVPDLPWATDGFSFNLIGPTILHWGTEEQKEYFIPRILSGEHRFCQGYSEPDAGSDLFSLRTRATPDPAGWRINGQKTWQTAGDQANWIFVLVRTGPAGGRARGLSLMLVPLDQQGVDVRPIATMTGHTEFSEVFFTDALCAAGHVIGGVDNGAKVALTLLGWERGTGSAALYVAHRIELDRLVALAREHKCDNDTDVRQRLAWCWSKVEILGMLGKRAMARAMAGAPPGPESSILKLFVSEYHARATELALDILGMEATAPRGEGAVAPLGADPLGAPNTSAAWLEKFMTSRAAVIYGGSSQIQRSTLGERVLALPREPRP